tara:strand:- start:4186 stop:4392 length:207 start_codon:yes stop_codon:yes gene_type:complete
MMPDGFFFFVAPHAGAWIETLITSAWPTQKMSPLTQGRGLKLEYIAYLNAIDLVAPHAGAWIETGLRF